MKPTFDNWKKFSQGKEVVTVRFTPEDVYERNAWFKTHREYISHLFKQRGVEITRFAHTYSGPPNDIRVEAWGLVFSTVGDRLNISETYEVNAIIGVNARYIKGMNLGEKAGNKISGTGAESSGGAQASGTLVLQGSASIH